MKAIYMEKCKNNLTQVYLQYNYVELNVRQYFILYRANSSYASDCISCIL